MNSNKTLEMPIPIHNRPFHRPPGLVGKYMRVPFLGRNEAFDMKFASCHKTLVGSLPSVS
jgi:hypothetical protein